MAPYRWICSITYEKNDGQPLEGGTGFLISDRHVLTAGHVIDEAGSGPAAPSLYVYPGRYYGGEPFGRFGVARSRVAKGNLDFGLITLTRAVGQGMFWWGHPSTNTAWWREELIPLQQLFNGGIPVVTAGYPGAKDRLHRRMMEARGTVVPGHSIQFRHTAPTTRGQSGSPLWTVRGGRLILLGIVTHRTADASNIALLAHGTLVRGVVEKWIREDAPRPVERRLAIEVPYRWVCRLEIRDNDVQRVVGYGTGLLISDRHALTSARVIYPFFRDPRRYSVRIVPGYEFGKEVFGSTTASRARVSPGFLPAMKDASQDYGLLTLSRSLGSGTSKLIGNAPLGSWGGASHGLWGATADGLGATVHAASFSRSAGGGSGYHRLRVSSGALVGLRKGQILHKASTRLDAPGAPIWIEKGGRRLLAGIASSVFSKDSDVNWGCYLDREALSHLMNWVNEDYERKGG